MNSRLFCDQPTHLRDDAQAQSSTVNNNRSENSLQNQGTKVVCSKNQRVSFHCQVYCNLIPKTHFVVWLLVPPAIEVGLDNGLNQALSLCNTYMAIVISIMYRHLKMA